MVGLGSNSCEQGASSTVNKSYQTGPTSADQALPGWTRPLVTSGQHTQGMVGWVIVPRPQYACHDHKKRGDQRANSQLHIRTKPFTRSQNKKTIGQLFAMLQSMQE